MLKQLNQLRGQAGSAVISTTATAVQATTPNRSLQPPAAVAPALVAPPPSPKPVLPIVPAAPIVAAAPGDLKGLWINLIEAVGRVSPFTRGYLIDAHPVSFEKNVLVIGYDPEFSDHLGLVDNSRNHTLLATKLSELGHPNSMIKFIKAEAPAGWERKPATAPPVAPVVPKSTTVAAAKTGESPSVAAPIAERKAAAVVFNKEEFKNDPLIKKALEIFKGTIVEVRA